MKHDLQINGLTNSPACYDRMQIRLFEDPQGHDLGRAVHFSQQLLEWLLDICRDRLLTGVGQNKRKLCRSVRECCKDFVLVSSHLGIELIKLRLKKVSNALDELESVAQFYASIPGSNPLGLHNEARMLRRIKIDGVDTVVLSPVRHGLCGWSIVKRAKLCYHECCEASRQPKQLLLFRGHLLHIRQVDQAAESRQNARLDVPYVDNAHELALEKRIPLRTSNRRVGAQAKWRR